MPSAAPPLRSNFSFASLQIDNLYGMEPQVTDGGTGNKALVKKSTTQPHKQNRNNSPKAFTPAGMPVVRCSSASQNSASLCTPNSVLPRHNHSGAHGVAIEKKHRHEAYVAAKADGRLIVAECIRFERRGVGKMASALNPRSERVDTHNMNPEANIWCSTA